MTYRDLRVDRERFVTVLTLSRERRRNALDGPLWSALREAAEAIARDPEPPRAVILTGSGGHFCAGMDLSFENPLIERLLPLLQARDENGIYTLIRELKGVLEAIARMPCPVIAAIEGACAGGGLELALACDFRVAASDAFFSLPETRVGMMPDVGGTVRTVRMLGRARAAELVLTGRRFTTAEALSWGLVTRACASGGALAEARALAEEIALNAPKATRAALEVLRATAEPDRESFERETQGGVRALLGGECVEGVAAFMEKRPAKW